MQERELLTKAEAKFTSSPHVLYNSETCEQWFSLAVHHRLHVHRQDASPEAPCIGILSGHANVRAACVRNPRKGSRVFFHMCRGKMRAQRPPALALTHACPVMHMSVQHASKQAAVFDGRASFFNVQLHARRFFGSLPLEFAINHVPTVIAQDLPAWRSIEARFAEQHA